MADSVDSPIETNKLIVSAWGCASYVPFLYLWSSTLGQQDTETHLWTLPSANVPANIVNDPDNNITWKNQLLQYYIPQSNFLIRHGLPTIQQTARRLEPYHTVPYYTFLSLAENDSSIIKNGFVCRAIPDTEELRVPIKSICSRKTMNIQSLHILER
ncbi:hypothetical protein BATDEDRAFT_28418 [Batrachochytrium dendrobatidis JAM81]|uniref:Uncharacterized protein n=1 Tax=Batrachochytrium dendrobatidis (strain JAM81 / FGSC 10211) TaxID=684364 RepID=F4PE23_BATDJ|nr:uncharacterized protein BATDEDRAFT_28418 [Batrachochytrium dendrobatidis JAM81]EGF76479.1 hypothetical protein BATDEDRAFT_28418 [Batrachochytrium dendrobatidis JAM81]|eukprot:XP_006682811.1 hypothetical protein BATDEDRAFT_28418 [Batrachochytrium dendrobatidis JAM81]